MNCEERNLVSEVFKNLLFRGIGITSSNVFRYLSVTLFGLITLLYLLPKSVVLVVATILFVLVSFANIVWSNLPKLLNSTCEEPDVDANVQIDTRKLEEAIKNLEKRRKHG